jgi:hypothetical protein
MRRLLISVTGGIFIPLLLFAFTMMMVERIEQKWGMGWLANALMFSVVGPMAIWERVFPPPPSCLSCGPTETAIFATIVTVFLFYAVLTYLIQVALNFRSGRQILPPLS